MPVLPQEPGNNFTGAQETAEQWLWIKQTRNLPGRKKCCLSSKGQRGDTRLGVVPEQPRSNPSASSCRACPVQLHAEEKGICSSSACSAARRGRGNNAPRPASRGAAAQHHAGAAACAVIHRGRSALSQRVCHNHGTHGCPVASPGKSCHCSGLILSSKGFFFSRGRLRRRSDGWEQGARGVPSGAGSTEPSLPCGVA